MDRITLEMDGITLASFVLAVVLAVVVPRLLQVLRAPKLPLAPRGTEVVVLECVELEARSQSGACAAAETRWVRCFDNFGTQIKAVRGLSAARDSGFCAIVVIDPLRNFEEGGLGTMANELVENYLRSLGRCASQLVPVYVVVEGSELLKLTCGGRFSLARPVIEALAPPDVIPPPAAAVIEALRRPRSFWADTCQGDAGTR